jgi:hypothetical protein
MNKVLIFSIASGVAGLGAGAGLGYYLAQEKLVKKFDEILEQQIADTKKFYERKHKVGDFETPEAAVEALGIPDGLVEEAADAVVNYGAMFIPAEKAVLVPEGVRTIQDVELPEQDGLHNVFGKEPGEPEQITFDEFAQAGDEYDSETVTYYMGDRVVAEQDDSIIDDAHRCVGIDNLQLFHDDENLTELYVKNDRLKTVYEITRSTGKYSFEVAGLDDNGQQAGDLQHADNFAKMPRRRRLQD